MDAQTKKIVLDYLDKNYSMNYESMVQFKAYYHVIEDDVRLTQVYDDIREIFDLDHKSSGILFEEWITQEAIRVDNDRVYSDNMTSQMDMVDRLSVWGSLGQMAKLRAIHENKNQLGDREPDRYEER